MGLQDGINCLYYGTEQGLRTAGEHDHDVRECLFDPYGEQELFGVELPWYKKVKETIQLTGQIKKKSKEVRVSHPAEGVVVLDCITGMDETYTIVYNGTSKDIIQTASFLPKENCMYTNYESRKTFSLRPFELVVHSR
jgi:hypothetical protein